MIKLAQAAEQSWETPNKVNAFGRYLPLEDAFYALLNMNYSPAISFKEKLRC